MFKRIPTMGWLTSALAVLCLVGSSAAWAHHSFAAFNPAKKVTVTGTVTEFNWTNPHSSFKVTVMNAAGAPETWSVEMGSPNNLIDEGWHRDSLKPGDKVTVTMEPLRDGRRGGSYVGVILADGKALGKPAGRSAAAPRVERTTL